MLSSSCSISKIEVNVVIIFLIFFVVVHVGFSAAIILGCLSWFVVARIVAGRSCGRWRSCRLALCGLRGLVVIIAISIIRYEISIR